MGKTMGKFYQGLFAALIFIAGCTQQGAAPLSSNQTGQSDQNSQGGQNNQNNQNNQNGGSSNSGGSGNSSGGGDTPVDNSKVVFSREIAPLMLKNCTGCHRTQGGIAPFPLETYDDFYNHREGIRKALVARTMPPPSLDNSGSCQSFTDSTWLPEADLKTLVSWIDNGAPKGDPGFKPQLPPPPMALAEPKKILKIPQPYTPAPPAGKLDDYRCFVVDPGVTSNTMITGIEVLPDEPKVVHHVIVFKPTSEAAQTQALQKSGSDGRPGYTCYGAAGVAATIVGLWAPGANAGELKDPETGGLLGLSLEAGRKLIVQVHYNTTNGALPDQTAIAVKTNDNAKPVKWLMLTSGQLNLAPGQADVVSTQTLDNQTMLTVDHLFESGGGGGGFSIDSIFSFPFARQLKIYGVGPHMHQLGRRLKLEMLDLSGKNTCVASVPLFDFNWQMGSLYKKPVTFEATNSMKISCNFDTRGRTEVTTFGEGTNDEMCISFLLVTAK